MNTTTTTQTTPSGLRPSFTNPAVRLMAMELMRCALETPATVADVFVNWQPHVDQVIVRAYAGGWRSDVDPDINIYVYLTSGQAEDELAKLLTDLREFLACCPAIVAEREAKARAEAARERQAFGDAIVRYRGAMEAGADEETLRAMRIGIDELMGAMKFEAHAGIWWDAKHGTWGLGALDEDDHALADSGAVICGPHA